jgi:4-diphosphocytidyl-2-C-methyl-D-erythritol kinase
VSSGQAIESFAPAKINLWLRVVGRRDDGYHLLDSLVAFADVGDIVRAERADALTLAVDGPFAAGVPAGDENLVLRATNALAEAARLPLSRAWAGEGGERSEPGEGGAARRAEPPSPSHASHGSLPLPPKRGRGDSSPAALSLTKNLPPASGIGGGSADAAAALRILTRLWHLDPSLAERVAPSLGADVPVCLYGRACRMQGVGERLEPIAPLPDCGIVLCNPGVPLATRAVFAARDGAFSPPFPPPTCADAAALAANIRAAGNDLQGAATLLCPPIADGLAALSRLPGALCAQMSGSGATCFALFPDAKAARVAAGVLPATWWRWGGALLP